MIFRNRNKKSKVPKMYFDPPYEHRFTFVPEGWTYYEGYSVQLSKKISTKKRAFYIASELFLRDHSDKANGSVAVFYGNAESPDCKDVLYGAYSCFNKTK